MAIANSSLEAAFTPEAYGQLVDKVLADKSVAFQASTVVQTDKHEIRFPVLVADGSVAWYPENATITLSDPDTDELVVTPKKIAALSQISNEAAADTNPAIAELTGQSFARAVGKGIDKAFFANTTSNGPSGLLSLTVTEVDSGTITNLDPFVDAVFAARANGAELSHFILAADVAKTLAKVKAGTALNAGLLENVGDGITLAGVPVLISNDVAAGNAWGIDATQTFVVQRLGTTVVKSSEAAFSSDATLVRVTARVGFGFANPAGLVRIYDKA